jgi:hypothetical protein
MKWLPADVFVSTDLRLKEATMTTYKKQFFDQCLTAIALELGQVEQELPTWPTDLANAAKIVSDKADDLFLATLEYRHFDDDERKRIVKEALRTCATGLRFLLSMDNERGNYGEELEGERLYYESAYL